MEKREFVAMLLPHLAPAVDRGYSARALLAQIALETGWAEHICKDRETGKTSNNLFNITADNLRGGRWVRQPGWKGEVVRVRTHEVLKGVRVAVTRLFRAYPSFGESVADYLRLIERSERYMVAYLNRGNVEEYFRALQEGGYATAEDYAKMLIATARKMPMPEER